MRPKAQNHPFHTKLLLLISILILAIFIVIISRSFSLSSSSPNYLIHPQSNNIFPRKSTRNTGVDCSSATTTCNKIPASIAEALIHYSTSTITPQQTLKEISVTSRILDKKSPCNFLIFGLGHDSLMWHSLNHGGRTVFLEEDEAWIEQIKRRFPMLESYHVAYDSKVNEANELMQIGKGPECIAISDPRYSMCQLALKGLPSVVYDVEWDLIMVDAPTGYYDEAPGRMTAIYTAGMMARNRKMSGSKTHVFVHDVNRQVEDKFSMEFLCEGYLKKQEGRLRHFVIPSHWEDLNKPFCPLI